VGVSASTEIQAAARGVVEENRRLRNLLKAYGVSDAEIDGTSGQQGPLAAWPPHANHADKAMVVSQ
jgi:hypothetical protein